MRVDVSLLAHLAPCRIDAEREDRQAEADDPDTEILARASRKPERVHRWTESGVFHPGAPPLRATSDFSALVACACGRGCAILVPRPTDAHDTARNSASPAFARPCGAGGVRTRQGRYAAGLRRRGIRARWRAVRRHAATALGEARRPGRDRRAALCAR